MLSICLTFDYELFFGENFGSPKEILFDPTEKLLEMLAQEGVSATFFADVCSVAQNEKYNQTDYVDGFSKQIIRMHENHQDVQLHIHPHWLTSEFLENKWRFDSTHYRLQSFGFDKSCTQNVYSTIAQGKSYLESIIQKESPDYRCIAYRAGGFTLQPHAELVKALTDNGICVDSSVAPHLVSNGVNSYDYSHDIPMVNWLISSEGDWWEDKPDSRNSLLEIPIATENKNITFAFRRLFNPNSVKLNLGNMRGTYIQCDAAPPVRKVDIVNYLFGYSALSMDAYRAQFLFSQLKRFSHKNSCRKKDAAIALIGHPKLVTSEYIDNLRALIKLVKANSNMQFKSISQVYYERKGK